MSPLLPLLLACAPEPPQYVYGVDLGALEYAYLDENQGVYPDNSLMDDPNNPFAVTGLAGDDRWDIYPTGAVPGFYAFGTWLALQPSGEAQYYTALAAQNIYVTEQAPADELWAVRELSIAGYRAVLEYFPDAVTYDAAGVNAYPLAPLAEEGITALGGDL